MTAGDYMKVVLTSDDLREAVRQFVVKKIGNDIDITSEELKIISEQGVLDEKVPYRVEVDFDYE